MIIAEQRNIKPLSQLFAPMSFALCDANNISLLNQQAKTKAIDFLYKMYALSFYSSYSVFKNRCAIVIDGASLLKTKLQNPNLLFKLLEGMHFSCPNTILEIYLKHM